MTTTSEIESFYIAGNKVGALVRQLSGNFIQTTLVFKIVGGPIVHLFQRTRFSTHVLDWDEYEYVDHHEDISVEVHADDKPLLRGPTRKPIPSYAAHLVLKDFLATDEPRRDFEQFNEGDPLAVNAAVFMCQGREDIETPWGIREALKVVLEVDGRAGNTFWCIDGSVVKSDWQGASSYFIRDIDLALEDLDAEVRTLLNRALPRGEDK